MSKVRVRLIAIIALAALFAATLVLALCLSATGASAADITYAATTVFSADKGGAVTGAKHEEGETTYLQFTLSDEGSVYFPRNLALKWYSKAEDAADSLLANPADEHYFSMTFALANTDFTRLTLTFEGAEENISKEGKTTNSILFKNENDIISVVVLNAEEQDIKDEDLEERWITLTTAADYDKDITITLGEDLDGEDYHAGEFIVGISYNGNEINLEDHNLFTNIGSYYLEYRSSGTTPATPLTFHAVTTAKDAEEGEDTDADEGEEEAPKKLIINMKELNGQRFALNGDGRVVDNAPAVLVLNEKIYPFTLGKRFSLTYEAIDVCVDSPSVVRSYYMLKKDTKGDGEIWHKPNEENDDDYAQLKTNYYFVPSSDKEDIQYVSIKFRLDDKRGTDNYEYVYLTWYAVEDAVAIMGDPGEDNDFDYILVNRVQKGPYYTDITVDDDAEKNTVTDTTARKDYQARVTEAAKNTSAGQGAYIYLPSLRDLIGSETADYRNLRFTISYYKPGQATGSTPNTESSLRYNALRFEINAKGKYVFKVFAEDASGQTMHMYKDGHLVSVSTSNVWDIDEIPTFTFEAKYTGASIEKPESQSVGYLDSTYTVSSFKIIALPGYTEEYTLYRLDASKLPAGEQLPGYDALWRNADTYFKKYYKEGDENSPLIKINAYNSDITEDDAAWERTDNDYEWYPESSTKSFRPQEATYYFVKLEVTDDVRVGYTQTAYQVIDVQNPRDTVAGRSDWLENNVTSVVLFSISAVLAVAIVVLFVVKPSDKKVEEVDLKALKGSKNDKNNKKKK